MQYKLQSEYIELYKLLKLLNIAQSGANAKEMIADGLVMRNNKIELRKRAKIIKGDILFSHDTEIVVI